MVKGLAFVIGLACLSIALASTIREASLSADMESDNDISSIMGDSFNPSCDAEVTKVKSACAAEGEKLKKIVSSECGDKDLKAIGGQIAGNSAKIAKTRGGLQNAETSLSGMQKSAKQASEASRAARSALVGQLHYIATQEAKLHGENSKYAGETKTDVQLKTQADESLAAVTKKAAETDDITVIKGLQDTAKENYMRYVHKKVSAAREAYRAAQTKKGVKTAGSDVASKKAALEKAYVTEKAADVKLTAEQKKVAQESVKLATQYAATAKLENTAAIREKTMLAAKAAKAKSKEAADLKQMDATKKKEESAESSSNAAKKKVAATESMGLKALLAAKGAN